jgi:hypothetical protein
VQALKNSAMFCLTSAVILFLEPGLRPVPRPVPGGPFLVGVSMVVSMSWGSRSGLPGAMRSLTKILLCAWVAVLLGGCFSMMQGAGNWWTKPGVDTVQRDRDWETCSKAHRGSEAIASTLGVVGGIPAALVAGAARGHDTAEGCMQDEGYTYTPLGPDGKPWKP